VLTVLFVMLAEVLVFAPSIANFRLAFLRDSLAAGHLASLALDVTPEQMIEPKLVAQLLDHAKAAAVVRFRDGHPRRTVLGEVPQRIDATFDLRATGFLRHVWDAFVTLLQSKPRTIRVVGLSPRDGLVLIEVFKNERELCEAMIAFSWRILGLSLIISFVAAALVYLALHGLLVRPLRRMTENMAGFRDAPEDSARLMRPSPRTDEIGFAERELRTMQVGLRAALRQKEHLAALGGAVTKINHDLRNMLASAQLVSDRLAGSADPEVKRVAPMLVRSLDRAAELCTRTLDYARPDDPAPVEMRFDLAETVDEVFAGQPQPEAPVKLVNAVPAGFPLAADRAQIFRVLQNLVRNAVQAGARTVTVSAARDGGAAIEVADDGPGLSAKARERLFEPFNAARAGGTGLGLAIVRDLVMAHGGAVRLVEGGAGGASGAGTRFRIELPRG
jgi:signal transduction histidine kinase